MIATIAANTGCAGLDRESIIHAVDTIAAPRGVVELRALHATMKGERQWPGTISGYFDSAEKLAGTCANITSAAGVYITANELDPALLARAHNRIRPIRDKQPTTADGNVQRRRWLLVDLDPVRPSGICSTDAEHAQAHAAALRIMDATDARGWPESAVIDTGNGALLLYRIDLPADDGGLVERVLKRLAADFDDARVVVDCTMQNPARIIRLPGTMNRKGDNVPDRPHRLATMTNVPETWGVVTEAMLTELGGTGERPPRETSHTRERDYCGFDVAEWIARHLPEARGPSPWKGTGERWTLPTCPFNESHADDAAFIARQPGGAICAGCQHNSCTWDWHELRERFDPKARRTDSPIDHRPRERVSEPATGDAAQTVLAALLHDPARWSGTIAADIFAERTLRRIATHAARLHEERGCIAPSELRARLRGDVDLSDTAEATLDALLARPMIADPFIRGELDTLNRAARQRAEAQVRDDALAALSAGGRLADVRVILDSVPTFGAGASLTTLADIAERDPWELRDQRLRVGLDWFDDRITDGGLIPGGLHFIAAAPGVGKTVMMGQVAFSWLLSAEDARVCWIMGEGTGLMLYRRLLAGASGLCPAVATAQPNELRPELLRRRDDALAEVRRVAPRLAITEDTRAEGIEGAIIESGAQLAVVDYFQLLQTASPAENETARLQHVSATLVRAAKSTGAALLVASSVTKGDNKERSTIDTLRGTGHAAHDADILIHGSREREADPSLVTWRTKKNRHGACGPLTMRLDGPACRFVGVNETSPTLREVDG